MKNNQKSVLRTWAQLLRLPNLFTVPGDVIAGAAWAGILLAPAAGFGIIGVLCLYCAGLLLNDFFDRRIDAEERPARPIPSGAIKPGIVFGTGIALLAAGITVIFSGCKTAAGIASILLSMCVIGYDWKLKNIPIAGPLSMGLCRGGSVCIGILCTGNPGRFYPFAAAAASVIYIMSVTIIASKECTLKKPGLKALLPAGAVLAGGAVLLSASESRIQFAVSAFLFATAAVYILYLVRKVNIGIHPVPLFIGKLLRTYIIIQAAWTFLLFKDISLLSGTCIILLFTVLAAGAEISSKKFYGS